MTPPEAAHLYEAVVATVGGAQNLRAQEIDLYYKMDEAVGRSFTRLARSASAIFGDELTESDSTSIGKDYISTDYATMMHTLAWTCADPILGTGFLRSELLLKAALSVTLYGVPDIAWKAKRFNRPLEWKLPTLPAALVALVVVQGRMVVYGGRSVFTFSPAPSSVCRLYRHLMLFLTHDRRGVEALDYLSSKLISPSWKLSKIVAAEEAKQLPQPPTAFVSANTPFSIPPPEYRVVGPVPVSYAW
ncbi:hypothetical protein JCM10908_006272 [Rhodotorula pacifica]|uniref:uncharacterized protein n=1 Tax=Rhodotorula pacifica TaxID=1495444 RepID=UPI0031816672